MKKLALTTTALSLLSSAAFAGTIDRTNQVTGVLSEQGRYIEFSAEQTDADLSGREVAPALGTDTSGDIADTVRRLGGAYKMDFNEDLSFALIYDQPLGVNVDYPAGAYFMQGSSAELNSDEIKAVAKYRLNPNVSVIGGLRYQMISGDLAIPGMNSYSADFDREGNFGYLVGAAYDMPEMGLNASLIYNSSIEHDLDTTESSSTLGANRSSTTTVETPDSVQLDIRKTLANDRVLFGGVHWVNWSEFAVAPADYTAMAGGTALAGNLDDTITYTVGMSQKINDQWSVATRVNYVASSDNTASNFAPVDGQVGVGVGAEYRMGSSVFSAGLDYTMYGDANVGSGGSDAAQFTDSTAVGLKVSYGYSF